MRRTWTRLGAWAAMHLLVLAAVVSGGCRVLLPAHSRSLDIEGKDVSVELVRWPDMTAAERDDWLKVFGRQSAASVEIDGPTRMRAKAFAARLETARREAERARENAERTDAEAQRLRGLIEEGAKKGLAPPQSAATQALEADLAAESARRDADAAVARLRQLEAAEAPALAPATGPLAAAAVGFAVDWAAKRLSEEADLYEHEETVAVADDKYWTLVADDRWVQSYHALRIVRKTSAGPSFAMTYGLCPSADESQLLIAPLSFTLDTTAAKVLGWKLWSYIPPFLLAQAFESSGNSVDVTVKLEIDGSWVNQKWVTAAARITTLETTLPRVDLDGDVRTWRVTGDGKDAHPLASKAQGWLGPVPISEQPNAGRNRYAGNFRVTATIQEKDPSNAKKYIERASTELRERKDDIVKLVVGDSEE